MSFEEKDQDSALRNQSLFQDGKTSPKLDPSKGTIFEPASPAKLHSATAKNRDKPTFATCVKLLKNYRLTRKNFSLLEKKHRTKDCGGTVFSNYLRTWKQSCTSGLKCTCSCSRTKSIVAAAFPCAPEFQCCWKQPQQSRHSNKKVHPEQKIPSMHWNWGRGMFVRQSTWE